MKRNLALLFLLVFAFTTNSIAQAPNPRLQTNTNDIKTPSIMDLLARINKLEEENSKLKKDLEEVKTNYTTLNNSIDAIKKDNGSQTFLIKGLDNSLTTLNTNLTTLKTDLNTLKTSFGTHFHKIKGGFSAGSEDGFAMHLLRSGNSLINDVETFKTTGGPIQ